VVQPRVEQAEAVQPRVADRLQDTSTLSPHQLSISQHQWSTTFQHQSTFKPHQHQHRHPLKPQLEAQPRLHQAAAAEAAVASENFWRT
jgi:hypothetical protein